MDLSPDNNNALYYGMLERNYGTKFSNFGSTRDIGDERSVRNSSSTWKNKRRSVLTTIKKMVRMQDSSKKSNVTIPFSASEFLGRELMHPRERGLHQGRRVEEEVSSTSMKDSEWWDPPQDSLPVEFCQDTSLHGLKYIGQPKRHISERIFWFATFVVGLTVAVWLISEMWNKYKLNPIIVSFQPFETNIDQVPFPAVTVCNMNKVLKSKAHEFMSFAYAGSVQAQEDLYYLEHVCLSTMSFAKRFNFSGGTSADFTDWQRDKSSFSGVVEKEKNKTKVKDFLRKAAQNCSDMIPFCAWHDQEYDCSLLFRPIETEYGKCCTFNMIPLSLLYTLSNDSREDADEISQWEKWNIDKDGLLLSGSPDVLEFPRRQMKAGVSNGLSFLLDVKSDEYYCTSSDSVGFRLTTHLSLELPKVADYGISLRPKSEIYVDVLPVLTMADPDIFSFSLAKRNCYKTEELKLRYFKHYSVNNCIDECIANETFAVCDCKRYYMPRDESEPLCTPSKFQCAEDVTYNKTKVGIRNTCSMCLQSCTDVAYEPQSTSTRIREGVWKVMNGSDRNWKEDDLSIVHVFIGEDSFYAKVRKELYGPMDLFANMGGTMGLCLGFSGLSLIELVYFLTVRAWWKRRRKQVIVTEEELPKWAEDTISTTSFINGGIRGNVVNGTEARENGQKQRQRNSANYFRSIFGEIRQHKEK